MIKKQIVQTSNAPAAIGPYSQAVKAGDFVFVSGQIPIDKTTKQIAGGGIAGQTHLALKNLEAVLLAAGSDLGCVVKTTVYLQDMGDFAAMNEVFATYFERECPARACVEAAKLPLGVDIEIEAIAVSKAG